MDAIDPCSDIVAAYVEIQESSMIEMLNIDILLIIFNFLSLYDKLMAMRVCKTWHQIISKHHAWTVIDFRDQKDSQQGNVDKTRERCKRFVSKTGTHVFVYREFCNPWIFLKTETNILKFLKHYAGKSLQELYIGGACQGIFGYKIIEFIETNCPNIKVLDMHICRSYKQLPFLSNLQFLKKLQLHVYWENSNSNDHDDQDTHHQHISYFTKCTHLQILHITICDFYLEDMQALSQMTHLLELDLHITETCYCNDKNADLTTNFESTIGQLIFLRVFRLQFYPLCYDAKEFDDVFLAIGHWKNLEILALFVWGPAGLCNYTNEVFETMLSGLGNLEILELKDDIVPSSVFEWIGTHLKSLKSLKLCCDKVFVRHGMVKVSSEAFETMVSGLLNLETLELAVHGMMTSPVVALIGTHLKNLKSLKLCDDKEGVGRVSPEAFERMISGLLYLETLELSGGFVTSSIVELIGIHLKNLKSLELSCGSYSDASIETLSQHLVQVVSNKIF